MWTKLKPINLKKIKTLPYPENKYFVDEHNKTQIVLHHTVSGPNVDGDIDTWIKNKYNIGTCIIIARDGTPYQIFSSKYWAHHIGNGNRYQEKRTIGIEIDNWGGLTLGTGNFKMFDFQNQYLNYLPSLNLKLTNVNNYYTCYGNRVNVPVQYYPNGFRGYQYYEKYTNKQIETVGELLLFWKNRYGIPINYHDDMWDVSSRAINGTLGVWSHISFRNDKSDCHPQPELIQMLKTIQNL